MNRYEQNDARNYIEIYFDRMPTSAVRDELKLNGFRWLNAKKCWFAKQSEKTLEIVKRLCANSVTESMSAASPVRQATKISENADRMDKVEPDMTRRYCYANRVRQFLKEDKASWKNKMRSAFKEEVDLPLSKSQIDAWDDCFDVLQSRLNAGLENFNIIFEYVLPYENSGIMRLHVLGKSGVLYAPISLSINLRALMFKYTMSWT